MVQIMMASAFGAMNEASSQKDARCFWSGRLADLSLFRTPSISQEAKFAPIDLKIVRMVFVNLSDKIQGGSADRSSTPAQLLHSKKCRLLPVQAHFGPWLTFAGAAKESRNQEAGGRWLTESKFCQIIGYM